MTAEATKTDDMLARLWETWAARLREEKKDTLCFEFRTNLLKVAISYARVTVVSFAFWHKFGQDASQGFNDAFFWRATISLFSIAWASSLTSSCPSVFPCCQRPR